MRELCGCDGCFPWMERWYLLFQKFQVSVKIWLCCMDHQQCWTTIPKNCKRQHTPKQSIIRNTLQFWNYKLWWQNLGESQRKMKSRDWSFVFSYVILGKSQTHWLIFFIWLIKELDRLSLQIQIISSFRQVKSIIDCYLTVKVNFHKRRKRLFLHLSGVRMLDWS